MTEHLCAVSTLTESPPSPATRILVSQDVHNFSLRFIRKGKGINPPGSGMAVRVCVSALCQGETFGRHGIQTLTRRRRRRERERESGQPGCGWVGLGRRASSEHPRPPLPTPVRKQLRLGNSIAQRLLGTLLTPPAMDSRGKSSDRGWGLK